MQPVETKIRLHKHNINRVYTICSYMWNESLQGPHTISGNTRCIYEYTICPKYLDRQIWTNSIEPDQMLLHVVCDQGLHCLPLVQQSGSKIDLLRF